MRISHFSVNRPVAVTMLVIAILILGLVSLGKLHVDLYPDLVFPIALVATNYNGAAPQEVENLVSRPLEGVLGTIENVKEIRSVSRPGGSQVVVEFNWGTDMDFATLAMREKIDMVKGMLPQEASSPMVIKVDPAGMAIVSIGMTGAEIVELKAIADDVIRPTLERVAGVASVEVNGGLTREIQVIINPQQMRANGLHTAQVAQILGGENMALPGGDVEKDNLELYIRLDGEFQSIQDIEQTRFPLPTGRTILLQDFAEVRDDFRDSKKITRMNGVPSIEINIFKQTDRNTVAVANEVRKALEELQTNGRISENIEFATIFDQSVFIKASVNNVVRNMFIGGVIALFVLYLFFRNFRSTIIISLAMPFAIIATFTMLYFAGQTLNMMTLGGLALGVGMMVDSSIVVLESIFRHRQMGKDMVEAAKVGSSEVGLAVLAASFTTIGVFIPVVFVDGIAAQFFRPLGLTVSIAIFASLVVSLTLIPMLASRLLHVDRPLSRVQRMTGFFGRFMQWLTEKYREILRWAIVHRKTVLLITTLLILASLTLIPLVGAELIPAMDIGEITVRINLPKGTVIEETERVTAIVEEYVSQLAELETIVTTIGTAGGMDFSGASMTERGRIFLKLVPLKDRARSTGEITEELRTNILALAIPNTEIEVTEADNMGGAMSSSLLIQVQGSDLEVLQELAAQILEKAKQVEGTRELKITAEEGRPELHVAFRRDAIAEHGLSAAQVMSAVRTAFQGQVVTRLKVDGDEVDVRLIYPEEQRTTIDDLEKFIIRTMLGREVTLQELVEMEEQMGPSRITRRGQSRELTIEGNIYGRDLRSIIKDISTRVDALDIPDGYFVEYGGQSQEMYEAFGDLYVALILAIALVYIIMAAQFEAFTYPFIIMLSLPATFVGVVVGLVVTGRPLSVTALIGVIMLAGIVVNNAIVLVDYINRLRSHGMGRDEAILEAGPIRLRPILMTTMTTVLALVPLAIGFGEGAEAQAPMATVVVFGLSFATLITLILIPVVYTLFDDLENKFLTITHKRNP